MKSFHPLQYGVLLAAVLLGALAGALWFGTAGIGGILLPAGIGGIVGLLLSASFRIADQWESAVILRLGRFLGLRGPGPFLLVPGIDRIAYWIDRRIITTSFTAEKTLTRDTVPVDVEAVLFWQVVDPVSAALAVEDYRSAISWASQTALRDVIGTSDLADMLTGREKLDLELQRIIGERTGAWGVSVSSVEIRDVLIPRELQDAMSMQAQAERERQARVILGESELQVAHKFEEAARSYENNPTALHLRAMNMLYEGLKEKATLVLVPASVLDTMTLGTVPGLVAFAESREGTEGEKPPSRPGQEAAR
ncbi:MAG: slipin family protein [Methanomicrobiales archaeon]|nr:slipin family protein [Methanomicrobiales archaeon]